MIKSSRVLYNNLYQRILPAVESPGECRAIVLRLVEYYFQIDALAITLDKPLVHTFSTDILAEIVQRIHQHEPIQYILGEAPFMNRNFFVNPSVLIPRPETEELVQLIIKENSKPGLHILDIGTGSGCIAITLAKDLSDAQVDGLDISEPALKVARSNAQRLQANVNWIQANILQDPLPGRKWDIIVSNPPYVCLSEKEQMQQRVLAYEPAQAIFVSDEAPLIFYEQIIQLASTYLQPTGKLYLEINERFGLALASKLADKQFNNIYIEQDLQGKDRWVKATAPYQ
ncbi:modification methylase, HemK family [Candidatus Amoebophilus asiaticus 5a2]|uniref:Modification methylase, HemK family n=1 Tax=Amoebophilus asiaticus (strain 5a2) TaxID=452471 RepID=B3EU58_AMOA5|nr:peptide chain release factor N(5)-glutamine methyltransferase [Candidatus Amoebophilus asiaticus]ACE05477.1 modification methylase, HemK family [Candidatus Amoebophilus asiaticus 5a2]